MKERITFVHGADDAFNPRQIRVEKTALKLFSLTGSREDRLTFEFQELPQEIWLALKQCFELRLRWSSATAYVAVNPYGSRVSAGLHAFFTPQKGRPASTLVCPLLKKVFGEELKCSSPGETFTLAPIHLDRNATAAAYSYYQPLPSLANFVTYVTQKACAQHGKACEDRVNGFKNADYMDMDYDGISQTLEIKIFRHSETGSWNDEFKKASRDARLEVGVLANETPVPPDPENLSLGGFTTVIGEDTKPGRVLFTFPSRHHALPPSVASRYTAAFVPPTGLHPVLRLAFHSTARPALQDARCTLYSHVTLPSTIFPDKYQLSAPLFLASKNLGPIRAISGETDLEAPDWAITKWGSSMLIELAPPVSDGRVEHGTWHADIPLHLRYLRPSPGGSAEAQMPWPVVFWACRAVGEGAAEKIDTNPFDRTNLGYEASFEPGTFFYHLSPNRTAQKGGLMERVEVPVLDSDRASGVEMVTALVIIGGVLWVLWVLARVAASAMPTGGEPRGKHRAKAVTPQAARGKGARGKKHQ